jgi:hypothetical protein
LFCFLSTTLKASLWLFFFQISIYCCCCSGCFFAVASLPFPHK